MLFVFVIGCLLLHPVAGTGSPDNRGTEFVIGFMENLNADYDDELFITTSRTTTVTVHVTTPRFSNPSVSETFTITSGDVKQVFISNNLRMYGTGKGSKGIRIKADDEVVVYGVNKEVYSVDGFLGLPVDVVGTEYYITVYYPSYWDTSFMVIGIQDSTSLGIRVGDTSGASFTYDSTTYSRNQWFNTTLNAYDTLQIQTPNEVTGSYIVASKPVSVMSGNRRTTIGSGSSSDHVVEQIMPVDKWGKKFATVPIPTRTTGDYLKFVASESGTEIVTEGRDGNSNFYDSFTLSNAGSYIQRHYSSQLYALITSNKPVHLSQFVLSQITEEADPAMIVIPPIEQYAADYVFSTPKYSQGSYTNYFMFVVSKSLKNGLRLDGASFPSTTYNSIPGTDMVAGYIEISEGSHTVRHTSPISVFGGYLFGLAKWESYGFPTGMRLAPINTVCIPTVTVTGDGIDNDCDGLIDEELCIPSNNGADDDGDGVSDEDCAKPPPVHGNWASWSSWGSCSQTCSPSGSTVTGTKSRTRTCTNPAPAYDGNQCSGSGSQSTSCTSSINCPIHGGWSSWASWGSCSVTCETGSQSRSRSCNNPTPQHGGNSCSGNTSSTITCTLGACPIDGGWSSWASWSSCSLTCGGGSKSRSRSCNNPTPQHGGASCSGSSSSTTSCNTNNCPIDGNWVSWTSWGSCTVTCGGGSKSRSRTCTNPSPQYGGTNCTGSGSSSTSCNTDNCPIDGGWSPWASWTSCTLTCGGGSKTRSRSCNNPAPQYGGASCSSSSSSTTSCNTHNCPIDGNWASWTSWGSCAVTCGGGSMTRSRTCTNPSPQYGGANCTGSESSSTNCNTHNCPIDGEWASWASWSTCTLTCGSGMQTKTRSCDNPVPQYGGAHCVGFSSSTQLCNTHNCPIDGNWASWNSWSSCTVTCGGGSKARSRTCTDPSPQYGGANCTGSGSSSTSCNTQNCPIDGGLTSWTSWGSCTVSCGGGTQVRTRSCTNPAPQYGGANCTGSTSESQVCNTQVCIIDGAWSAWGQYGTCSVTCGGGQQSRTRTCTNPSPANGGLGCSGSSSELTDCNTSPCPTAAAGQYIQLCPSGWFTCQSGGISCIDNAFKCDCANDCDDGSDEDETYASCSAHVTALCKNGAEHVLYSWTQLVFALLLVVAIQFMYIQV